MTRDRTEICALCNEYSVREAEPEYAELGMGRCMLRDPRGYLKTHVAWNNKPCVGYKLDKPNLAKRRQYIAVQQQKDSRESGNQN